MSEKLWNKDVDNVFGLLRLGMYLNGTWPLSRKDCSARIRWALGLALLIVIQINLSIDIMENRAGTNGVAEALFLWNYTFIFEAKHICLYLHAKLLEENVNSAIEDWWHAQRDAECRMIMKKYSRHQRKFTVYITVIVIANSIVYWIVIFLTNIHREHTSYQRVNDTDSDNSIPRQRSYMVPSSWINDKIGDTEYVLLCILHLAWDIELILDESWSTTFYYTIVTHLAGQFEILCNEFRKFGSTVKPESILRRKLGYLVRRQYQLIKLAENLRASFAEIIFVQFGLTAAIVAVLGLRVIMNIKHSSMFDIIQSMMGISYLLMVTSIYTYTADFLSLQSENIFDVVAEIPWYDLPQTLAKDLTLIMMRSEKPVRLSGGKFFYVSRSTLMYIINTAISYISVLNATIKT